MPFKGPRAFLALALVLWSLGLSNTELLPDDVGTNGDNGVPAIDAVPNTQESDATTPRQQPHLILIVADDLGEWRSQWKFTRWIYLDYYDLDKYLDVPDSRDEFATVVS